MSCVSLMIVDDIFRSARGGHCLYDHSVLNKAIPKTNHKQKMN